MKVGTGGKRGPLPDCIRSLVGITIYMIYSRPLEILIFIEIGYLPLDMSEDIPSCCDLEAISDHVFGCSKVKPITAN